MRRPKAEASHQPPYIEDLLHEAVPHVAVLGELTVADLALASADHINALHGLWATFSKLPQKGPASCVGITKAILLLTNGRIGPAFDSTVRNKLGLKNHLKSSEEWVGVLRGISEDIHAFEERHGNLAEIVPEPFAKYQVGRLYDMVLAPGTLPPFDLTVIGPYEPAPATCGDHDPRAIRVAERVGPLIETHIPGGGVVEHIGSTAVPGCAGKGVVDLMVLYEPGRLPEVRKGLDALGFQRQTGRDPFPEERPMRVGSIDKVDIRKKLALFQDHWHPRIVGELNGQHVKLVKFQGEFVWHKHDHEDELFLVIQGRFRMEYRDRHVWLEESQFLIVPRGVEHRPVAEEEVHVLLFEPAGTLNTGDAREERTVEKPERI